MHRPLVFLTVIYILVIIIFHSQKISEERKFSGAYLDQIVNVSGVVATSIQEYENKTSFLLNTLSINGKEEKKNILVNCYSDLSCQFGDLVSIKGKIQVPKEPQNPGGFNYREYLSRRGIYLQLSVYNEDDIKIEGKAKISILNKSAFFVKGKMAESFFENMSQESASLLLTMLIGEKWRVLPEVKRVFIDAGVMHVLVVSGLNVGYVIIIFFTVFKLLRFNKKISLFLTLPFIWFYVIIVGFNPPVVRASIMATVGIISYLLKREPIALNIFSLSALFILVFEPEVLFDPSFQLSFVAVGSILYFTPPIEKGFFFLPVWLKKILAVSLAAQLGVLPLMAYYFNKISIAAILSNIIIVPLLGIIMILGITLFFVSMVSNFLAGILGFVEGTVIFVWYKIIEFFGNLPPAVIRVPSPSVMFCIVFYLFIGTVFRIKEQESRNIFVGSLFLFILLGIKGFLPSNELSITFLAVGNGDSIFIKTPARENILIDGGGSFSGRMDVGEDIVSKFLWEKRVFKIDKIILTHAHLNHYQGLIKIMKNFKVGAVYTNGEGTNEDEYLHFKQALKDEKIKNLKLKRGDILSEKGIKIEVLNPETLKEGTDDNSIVLKVSYNNFSLLLTGDIGKNIQRELMESGLTECNILQAPRHGKSTILKEFLMQISPEYVIISTDNPGDKLSEQLSLYKNFSTNESGAITIITDGKNYRVKKYLN